jgi:hypothetical protein
MSCAAFPAESMKNYFGQQERKMGKTSNRHSKKEILLLHSVFIFSPLLT